MNTYTTSPPEPSGETLLNALSALKALGHPPPDVFVCLPDVHDAVVQACEQYAADRPPLFRVEVVRATCRGHALMICHDLRERGRRPVLVEGKEK